MNKDEIIKEILEEGYIMMEDIPKEYEKDEEFIKNYWNAIDKFSYNNYPAIWPFCSVIGIDEFGNRIIDLFRQEELMRHTQKRIEKFKESFEPVQFVKSNNGNFDKKIFEKRKYPLIILIGNEKNVVAEKIINQYNNIDTDLIDVIEIYAKDIKTQNIKFISNNEDEILDFLRIILYSTADDTPMSEDNLVDLLELLPRKKSVKNINMKDKMTVGNMDIIDKFKGINGSYYIQITTNSKLKLLGDFIQIMNKIINTFHEDACCFIAGHTSCVIDEIEIRILDLDLDDIEKNS